MWNTRKQRQLDALRSREEQATLTPKERQRLATLLRELEQDELAALRPALDAHEQEQRRLQDELGQIRTRNAAIAGLADRYAELLARAKALLAGLMSERDTLRAEYERVQRESETGRIALKGE